MSLKPICLAGLTGSSGRVGLFRLRVGIKSGSDIFWQMMLEGMTHLAGDQEGQGADRQAAVHGGGLQGGDAESVSETISHGLFLHYPVDIPYLKWHVRQFTHGHLWRTCCAVCVRPGNSQWKPRFRAGHLRLNKITAEIWIQRLYFYTEAPVLDTPLVMGLL